MVGILPDQQPKAGDGEFAPFFGVPALTMTLLAGWPSAPAPRVLFAWCERIESVDGAAPAFALHVEAAPAAIADPDPRVAVAALNAARRTHRAPRSGAVPVDLQALYAAAARQRRSRTRTGIRDWTDRRAHAGAAMRHDDFEPAPMPVHDGATPGTGSRCRPGRVPCSWRARRLPLALPMAIVAAVLARTGRALAVPGRVVGGGGRRAGAGTRVRRCGWGGKRHATPRWRLDDDGLAVRRGRLWRSETRVPASRVQHLDLKHGPLERRRALATLVVHTAGTRNSAVTVAAPGRRRRRTPARRAGPADRER